MQKSLIFFAGVDARSRDDLKRILPIPEGSLPVQYLGVPLISTRLEAQDCATLKEKIMRRIQVWPNQTSAILFTLLKRG
ncbi:hypothetical protein RHMOL_Rhmol06G0069200 [Rhododendron molle]|uniref:Uncharacterized protein n=1 Tax=Rhododendron molle TaxID=49168 RepID=A0ACC0NAT3_RHOML|nr:hypothetical protein RHMOL_Rhmol06G0069200 [Rhododendron molle]